MGSAALDLCLVAKENSMLLGNRFVSWDVAAPSLICKEVGLFSAYEETVLMYLQKVFCFTKKFKKRINCPPK